MGGTRSRAGCVSGVKVTADVIADFFLSAASSRNASTSDSSESSQRVSSLLPARASNGQNHRIATKE
jgi:hypothetical protein